jgi:hypothetical protein
MTPSGIEPATFRFVAQYLNHCATISGPQKYSHINFNLVLTVHVVLHLLELVFNVRNQTGYYWCLLNAYIVHYCQSLH